MGKGRGKFKKGAGSRWKESSYAHIAVGACAIQPKSITQPESHVVQSFGELFT